jgi:hypothetical protein
MKHIHYGLTERTPEEELVTGRLQYRVETRVQVLEESKGTNQKANRYGAKEQRQNGNLLGRSIFFLCH